MMARLIALVTILLMAAPTAAGKGKCSPRMMTSDRDRADVALEGRAIGMEADGPASGWRFGVERYIRGSGPPEVTVFRLSSSLRSTRGTPGSISPQRGVTMPPEAAEIEIGEVWRIYGTRVQFPSMSREAIRETFPDSSPLPPAEVNALLCSGSHPVSVDDPTAEARRRRLVGVIALAAPGLLLVLFVLSPASRYPVSRYPAAVTGG